MIKLSAPVSILMPVCNEADIIESVIEEWVRDVFRFLPEGSEFLLDEASTDGTMDVLRRLCGKYPFLKVCHNERADGFAAAARRLYTAARCPLVFFTDSDGQYVASEFWKLAPYVENYSIVHGAKIGRQDTFFRKAASGVFNRLVRFLFDIRHGDVNSAFRIIRREALAELVPQIHCMPTLFNAEMLLRAELNNYSIRQIFILHRRRAHGVSRGLPPHLFIRECFRTLRGLMELKNEFKL